MKTIHCVSSFNGKSGIVKRLICLFGVFFFLSIGPTSTYALAPFFAGQSAFDPAAVIWSEKTHYFEGPNRLTARHVYHFKGHWRSWFYSSSTDTISWCNYTLTVTAVFDTVTEMFNEEITFEGLNDFLEPNQTLHEVLKYTTKGSSTNDPWLLPLPVDSINTILTVYQFADDYGTVVANSPGLPRKQVPTLFSQTAFTQEEREALWMEEPVSLTCSSEQIQQPPIVNNPTPGRWFKDYDYVVVDLEIPCRPVESVNNMNQFNVVVEEEILDNLGNKYWHEIYGVGDLVIPMTTNKYNYKAKGVQDLKLEHSGQYRLKANHQANTGEVITGGPPTDWIYFRKGMLEIDDNDEVRKPGTGSTSLGNNASRGQVGPAQFGATSQMTGNQLGEKEGFKTPSGRAPELVLSGDRLYNPRRGGVRLDPDAGSQPLIPVHVIDPRPAQNFVNSQAVPVTLEFDCCSLQNGTVDGNYFDVEIQRSVWDGQDVGQRWQPHQEFQLPMGSCQQPLEPCAGSTSIDLTQGISLVQPGTPQKAGDQYRIRARGRPFEQTSNSNPNGPWSGWVTFSQGDIKIRPELFQGSLALKKTEGSDSPDGLSASIGKEKIAEQQIQHPDQDAIRFPDLQVSMHALMSENPQYEGNALLIFQITNKGIERSPASQLSISCEPIGGAGPCPNLFDYSHSYNIGGLAAETGSQVIAPPMTLEGMATPPQQGRYRFTARIDPDDTIAEENEDNNETTGFFPGLNTGSDLSQFPGISQELKKALGQHMVADQAGATADSRMTTEKIKSPATMQATSGRAPELVLSGNKLYNPRQIVTFTLQGDLAEEPVLEFSPDGRQWKTDSPAGSSLRKLGEGTSVRFIAQGGAPGMYRLRYGSKTSDFFEVKAAVGPASLRQTQNRTTGMMATKSTSPAPIKKPSIWFDLSSQPAPTPKMNQPFNIMLGVKNIGEAANGTSPLNKVVVRLSCQPLDGGNCDKLLGDPVVPVIAPGNTGNLSLTSVFKATKSGKYRVSMVLDPEPQNPAQAMMKMGNLKKSHSFEFSISERKIDSRKTPGAPANKAPLKAVKPSGPIKKMQ